MNPTRNLTYSTKVVDIGAEAQDFKAVNMLIFFGDEAPDLLKSSCFIINVEPLDKDIEVGQTLQIGEDTYKITAVGNEVSRNLGNLGHMAVKFTGETEAGMPGSIYVEKGEFPHISKGTEVKIY
ncbi:PTS sorbitol transporter subunit IIA [Lactobacillus amylovorus]|jgi:PTS system glucitol/sorbitol-specific IIA component|uniref:PTS glucitol/sorbitol transporter subunit IIA n=1 Tax=Lactobacillus amylovorus TaxID=1604 RepID=UPI0021A6FA84|nr:PTS glucitol/sorbitol transporter subunit IIA [Lactobacillus amylovorus]MCH3997242.1 PTS glucitol/sorbitol transporter subunit IIA [Lactobacillus amylovorus]MCI1532026.1 PTS glucitol/sorbitol transporter subunit IIA [Lactobacillus amylovorus]MCT3585638.1 PTS sorbitol transporter subunit IIA [Lactobacillus amylovorus]